MIHDCQGLCGDKLTVAIELLEEWKEKQLALQVGCSLYEYDDIAEKFLRNMDIIQLPISVYDQRPQKSGFLKRLKDMGICIHARSIYLQGLLAVSSEKWPSWVDCRLKNHHEAFEQLANKMNTTTAGLACAYIKSIQELDYVVVGLRSVKELTSLVKIWEWADVCISGNVSWDDWGVELEELVDPRKWQKIN